MNVRQRRAAATRQQLLTAACRVFEDEGYPATSVGAITDRADTAHGTFYLYFRNKEDAFCQVMEEVVVNDLITSVNRLPDQASVETVEPVVRGFLDAYRSHWRLWRAALQAALVSPRVKELWLDLRRLFIERMATLLEAERARGACRPLDPMTCATALTSMVEGFAFVHFGLQEPLAGGGAWRDGAGGGRWVGVGVAVGIGAGSDGGRGSDGGAGAESAEGVDHAVAVLTDLWRHAVYGRLPV